MDPFSIVVGSVGIIDVCTRLVRYFREFEKAVAEIDQDIKDLLDHVETVALVVNSINDAFGSKVGRAHDRMDADTAIPLWKTASTVLHDCRCKMEKLEVLVKDIKGRERPKGPSKFDGFGKQLRKQAKEEEYRSIRNDLDSFLQKLQTMLQIIDLSYNLRSQITSDQLSEDIRTLNSKIDLLRLDSELSRGRVSSIFTGREAQLEELKAALLSPLLKGQSQIQRRFVVSGLGGSGKTQFCCKFAEESRKHFWGVFWVNASSSSRARQTLSGLAKRYAAREPNESAAKDWLSNLEVPWLLIIDDAASDDSEFNLESLFPDGERGHILITTRDDSHKIHGTVGPKSFEFGNMDVEPATSLLLKAACTPEPWDASTRQSASLITKALGYLPLALVYAGKAIMEGLCTLQDYVSYYVTSWQRIQQARNDSDDQIDQDLYMSVYSGFEIVYLALKDKHGQAASDALELLNMFAFLSNGEIRESMLEQAAKNPALEREQEDKDRLSTSRIPPKQKSWAKIFTETKLKALTLLVQDNSQPVLPQVLRHSESSQFDLFRLRKALRELNRRSLIIRNFANQTYSMHPIVHTWVRERPEMMKDPLQTTREEDETMRSIPKVTRAKPEMRTGRQALWCQAARTMLAQAILLPPLGDQAIDEELRRGLLPHVEYVQKRQAEIREQVDRNQRAGKWFWPVRPTITRREAIQLAKFSRVYGQCGLWNEAMEVQTIVKDYVCQNLGPDHPNAIRIQIALSLTYRAQGRGTEAMKLQQLVLEACLSSLGSNDTTTLKIMDALGESNWQLGHFKQAKALHQQAIDHLTWNFGSDHEDTLRATDHLGRVELYYQNYHEARELHMKALEGMLKAKGLGPAHLDTLTAQENLAIAHMLIGGERGTELAHKLMVDVVDKRKEKLGEEHPWTLLSTLNLARVRSAQGFYDEAEAEIRTGLEIARRNLGPEHGGTLFGEARLGQVFLRQERYVEAEDLLQRVPRYYKRMARASDGAHPDRLIAMLLMVHCYRLQGKYEAAIDTCDECITRLESIGDNDHSFMTQLKFTREALRDPNDRGKALGDDWKTR